MRATSILLVALVAGACSLDRVGIGAPADAEPVDAGELDAFVADADLPDAPADADVLDASADAGLDASFDAGTDAGPCVPALETCDLTDQDCDLRIDEAGACAGCRAFEHGGHVYQDCPHVTGYVAWGGACRRIGPGYDLVVIETSTEDDAIDAAISEPSWLGLNDFDANGARIWVERSPPVYVGPWISGEGSRDSEPCFLMHASGEWDDATCHGVYRVLCEGDPADRCVPSAASDPVCDGVDDDCDGAVDEDCALGRGCTSFTFWDHAFLSCTTPQMTDAARMVCLDVDYDLATIDNAYENDAVAPVVGEVWIGLRQAAGSPATDAGWTWVGGSASAYRKWGAPQPDDSNGSENGQEDCTRMRISDDWGDLGCTTPLPFVCRRDIAR